MFHLRANVRGTLPEGLRRLLRGLLVADIIPFIGIILLLKEPPPGRLRPNGMNDGLGHQHFLLLGERDVQAFVRRDEGTPVIVTGVVVRSAAATAEDVRGGVLYDVFEGRAVRHGVYADFDSDEFHF